MPSRDSGMDKDHKSALPWSSEVCGVPQALRELNIFLSQVLFHDM